MYFITIYQSISNYHTFCNKWLRIRSVRIYVYLPFLLFLFIFIGIAIVSVSWALTSHQWALEFFYVFVLKIHETNGRILSMYMPTYPKSPTFIGTKDRHRMTQCTGQSKLKELEKIMNWSIWETGRIAGCITGGIT